MADDGTTAGPYSIGSKMWPGLSRLIEEAAEVLQVAGKIIGADGDVEHFDGTDLSAALAAELADLQAAIRYARAHMLPLVVWRDYMEERTRQKFEQYQRWHGEASDA